MARWRWSFLSAWQQLHQQGCGLRWDKTHTRNTKENVENMWIIIKSTVIFINVVLSFAKCFISKQMLQHHDRHNLQSKQVAAHEEAFYCMSSETDANNTLSICVVTAKISWRGGEEGRSTAGERKDTDDSNKQLVPQLTLVMGVILQLPNLSGRSNR